MKAGITKYKKEKLWYLPPKTEETRFQPLGLEHIMGLVVFLSVGLVSATIVFFLELWNKKGNKSIEFKGETLRVYG